MEDFNLQETVQAHKYFVCFPKGFVQLKGLLNLFSCASLLVRTHESSITVFWIDDLCGGTTGKLTVIAALWVDIAGFLLLKDIESKCVHYRDREGFVLMHVGRNSAAWNRVGQIGLYDGPFHVLFWLFWLSSSEEKQKIVQLKRELRSMPNLCCLIYMINTAELFSCLTGKELRTFSLYFCTGWNSGQSGRFIIFWWDLCSVV